MKIPSSYILREGKCEENWSVIVADYKEKLKMETTQKNFLYSKKDGRELLHYVPLSISTGNDKQVVCRHVFFSKMV